MYTVEVQKGKAKHTVTFYDSIHTLPYRRYHKFNKHMMIQMEVGDTVEDYDRRMSRAIQYLNNDDKESASKELTNQRQCLHNIYEGYSPQGMALACMVYSIDDNEYKSYEEEILESILDKLDEIGFTKGMLDGTTGHVKKK